MPGCSSRPSLSAWESGFLRAETALAPLPGWSLSICFLAASSERGVTWTVIRSMEQLGPAKAALLIVMAQLIVAYLIELAGLFGVEKEPLEVAEGGRHGAGLIGVAIFQWK